MNILPAVATPVQRTLGAFHRVCTGSHRSDLWTMLIPPTLGSHTFTWCGEELESAMSTCRVNVSSLSLLRIGCSVKIDYGLCLLCALSFNRHLCCSEELIQVIKANLFSVWVPLQQVSRSPPHRHISLCEARKQQRTKRERDGGMRGRDSSWQRVSLPMPAGAFGTLLQCSCPKYQQSLSVFINWHSEFGGRKNSHEPCCTEFKLISFCCAHIWLSQHRLQHTENWKVYILGVAEFEPLKTNQYQWWHIWVWLIEWSSILFF